MLTRPGNRNMSVQDWPILVEMLFHYSVPLGKHRNWRFHQLVVMHLIIICNFEHVVRCQSMIPFLSDAQVSHALVSNIWRDVFKIALNPLTQHSCRCIISIFIPDFEPFFVTYLNPFLSWRINLVKKLLI